MENTTSSDDAVNTIEAETDKDNVIEIEIPFPLFQYLSSDECNLQNICRICLSVNDPVLNPLFSSDEQIVLATMLMSISEVQMSADDGLPSNVCPRCQTEVMNFYEFKMKCVKADYTLKSVLKGEFNIEKSPSDNNNDKYAQIVTETLDNYIEEDNKKNDDADGYVNYGKCTLVPVEENDQGIEYLKGIKESISDEETLCVVQRTDNNQKENTVLETLRDTQTLLNSNDKPNELSRKETKHQCRFCRKKFDKVHSLRKHIRKRHPAVESDGQYPCKDCKKAFDSEFDLKLHGMLHNQCSGWKCTECQKDFKGRPALRRHIERHMRRRRFVCERCGAAFVEQYALQRHMRVHAPKAAEKIHACTQCDKRFAWKAALVAHMSTHSRTRDSICGACGVAFASARLLASHERVHSNDLMYACTYCERRFRHKSTRNTHVRTHTGERPYGCEHCGKSFIQLSNKTLHMRTHTGEKPYTCTFCDRKFSSSSTLKAHKRTHTGERPHSCKICGKSMKIHMRVHSGERPHACPAPACGKSYLTANRLRDHYRLHTGEKPFECANCNQKFTTKCQLITHVKRYDKKKKAGKKVMLKPITVSDKVISTNNQQIETQPKEVTYIGINEATIINEGNLCTMESPIQPTEGLIYQDDANVNTEVIVLDSMPSVVTNHVIVNNVNDSNSDVNLVTLNEGEMSISAASAAVDGTVQTVKLYQYDQSLLQIHTGGGHLTISRISSKMTNF